MYKGVSWSEIDDAVADEIQWPELPDIIPRTAICLKENVPHIHTVLIPTQYVTNGNTIIKRINFCQKTLTWQLTIRGKIIDIGNLGLDNSFSLSAKSVHIIIDAVDKIIICTGLLTEKDEEFVQKLQNKEFVKEFISVGGDENTGEMRVRSQSKCTQVRTWSQPFSMNKGPCRNCQIDCCKYRAFIRGLKKITVHEQNSTTDETEQNGNLIQLEDSDHTDMSVIMDKVFPNAPVAMKVLLKAQYGALRAKTKQSRHWDKQVISICLSLWVRSPKAYADLSDSKMLILPSGRQLRRYKNFIPQKSGICDQVLEWMMEAAKEAKVPSHGWAGGLHHDETKLQQDLVLSMRGGKPSLVGWIDVGDEAANLRILKEGCVQQTLATEVIQFTFMGYTGFRFPVCHFPTSGVKSSELHIIIWEAIAKLQDWGFTVDFILQDGGEENRQFMKSNFLGDPLDTDYTSPNLTDQTRTIVHSQDFSHNIKKLHNAVLSSGDVTGQHTRKLMLSEKAIVWQHWIDAVEWDRTMNSRPIHYKVTDTHLYPNGAEKMRNQLGEDMLNEDMLHLMREYQSSLSDVGMALESTVQLLEQTSQLISVFRDKRLVTSMNGARFDILSQALAWFKYWRDSIKNNSTLTNSQKSKMLPSTACMDDTLCMLVTFPKVCDIHLSEYNTGSVMPSRFNNDVAENMFCQQRGLHNGNATNPNYSTYCSTVNSVLLGQSLLSRGRKSNAGLPAAKPFQHYVDGPTAKRIKKSGSVCIRV